MAAAGPFSCSQHCWLPAGLAWVTGPGHGPTPVCTISLQGIFPDVFPAPLESMPPSREETRQGFTSFASSKVPWSFVVYPQALRSCWHCQQMYPMTELQEPRSVFHGACSDNGPQAHGPAGVGNKIHAEGGGLISAYRKEEILSDFLLCSC